jgi:hypothetical protein
VYELKMKSRVMLRSTKRGVSPVFFVMSVGVPQKYGRYFNGAVRAAYCPLKQPRFPRFSNTLAIVKSEELLEIKF